MKKILKEFGGALLLYSVIFIGIVAISSEVAYINENNANKMQVAINK